MLVRASVVLIGVDREIPLFAARIGRAVGGGWSNGRSGRSRGLQHPDVSLPNGGADANALHGSFGAAPDGLPSVMVNVATPVETGFSQRHQCAVAAAVGVCRQPRLVNARSAWASMSWGGLAVANNTGG